MGDVAKLIELYDAYIIIGLTSLLLIFFFYTLSISRKLAKINRRRERKLEEGSLGDIVDYISEHTRQIEDLKATCSRIDARQSSLDSEISMCLKKIGIVRFNAFEDVGGEQSFALALVDSNANGVLISNLYGRQESRLYVKRVINGESERALSDEEKRALDIASNGRNISELPTAPV